MAAMAIKDQMQRSTEVDRKKLIAILETNREKHVRDYEEAKAGYKAVLLEKVDEAFRDAAVTMQKRHEQAKRRIAELTENEISKQRDYQVLVDEISVEMKVPRSFAKEYDAAIDIAKWDVRDTLTLTYAEFACFVRDEWDWKSGFDAVSSLYKALK